MNAINQQLSSCPCSCDGLFFDSDGRETFESFSKLNCYDNFCSFFCAMLWAEGSKMFCPFCDISNKCISAATMNKIRAEFHLSTKGQSYYCIEILWLQFGSVT